MIEEGVKKRCQCFMMPAKFKCPYYDQGADEDSYCKQRFPNGLKEIPNEQDN